MNQSASKTFFAPQLFIPGGVTDISFYSHALERLKSGHSGTMIKAFMLRSFPSMERSFTCMKKGR